MTRVEDNANDAKNMTLRRMTTMTKIQRRRMCSKRMRADDKKEKNTVFIIFESSRVGSCVFCDIIYYA